MQRTRKFLSVILAIMMVISVFPITASAITSGDWTYSVISEANKTARITDYSGTETILRIPSIIDDYTITSIGSSAFDWNETITHVTIPDSVTSIGSSAFYMCKALERVVIPEGVTTISKNTFWLCDNLTNVVIPSSVTKIEDYAFDLCSNLEVVFYSGTKEQWKAITIGEYNSDIKSATVYYECENNQFLSGSCGDNALWALDVAKGILTISGTGDIATYNAITAFVPWNKCKSLIKKVVVNDGITSISSKAFYDCTNLTSVSIPASVTKIGTDVFRGCANIASISVDSNNENYSNDPYGALFDKDKTRLIKYAGGNGEASYTIPDTVIYVNAYAFENASTIQNVIIPDNVTNVYSYAFSNCRKLESVTMGNGLTEIADYTFYNCVSLKNIEFGNNITTLGYQSFYGCYDLENIVIPENVTTLEERVFENCINLKAVLIPKSITTISWGVFYDCDNVTEVYYTGTEEQWKSVTIENYNDCLVTAKIHYNADHIHDYKFSWTAPTCTEKALNKYTCECGYFYIEESGKPNGHTPVDDGVVTREPTCSLEGEMTFVCEVCEEIYTEPIDRLSHTKEKIPAVAPTHTSTGLTEGVKCSVCGEILVEQQVVPMIEVSGTCGDNLTWIFDIETYTLTISGTGDMDNYLSNYHPWMDYENEIKKIVVEDGVTSIGAYAFYNYSWVTEVDLPDTLVKIGDYALYGCSMTSIELADTLTTIGECAFKNCDDLTEIIIPEGITEIGTGTFYNNKQLTKVSLPSTLTTICGEAFYNCRSLESIDIPDSVTTIGGYAFYYCITLTSVEIPASVSTISESAFLACHSLEEVILNEGLKTIEEGVFESCSNLAQIEFPSTLEGIYGYAFRKSGLTSVTIPAKAMSFGAQVFAECPNLTDATFEDGATFIGREVFYKCTALKNVYIPSSVTIARINSNAFDSCTALENVYFDGTLEDWLKITFVDAKAQPLYYAKNLYCKNDLVTEVVIPETVTTINAFAFFNYDKLTSVEIPSTVKTINKSAFYSCSGLINLTIHEGVSTFDSFVFGNCDALTSVTIPDSLISIGTNVFEDCDALTKVIFAEGSTTTGPKTFYSCDALKEVVLPTSIKTIDAEAFSNCISLETISIPANVTTIGLKAFDLCKGLTDIIVDDENQQFSSEDGVLFNKNKTYLILYPMGRPETSYKIPDGVTTLQKYAFANSSLNSVIVPTSMSQIYGYAFYECKTITDIYYVGTKTQWNAIAKDDYYNTYLGNAILHCEYEYGDYKYTVISEADKTIRIEKYNLYDSATKLVIPSVIDGYTVTEIGTSAFESRTQFKNIIIPETVTKIGERAFYQCTGINKIIIPESVTEISANAFYGCLNLAKVLFNSGIKTIGIAAFNYCTKLADVYYTSTEAQWNAIAIGADNEPLVNAAKYFEYNDNYVSASGTCGDNLIWVFNHFAETLTISGTGDMYDYTSNSVPWKYYKSFIENVIISNGVTSIGKYAFYKCSNLTSVIISDSVKTIDSYVFYNCSKLKTVTIGTGMQTIWYYAFYGCSGMKDVYYLGTEEEWNGISIADSFSGLDRATIHYLGEETHECTEKYVCDSVVTAPTCTEQGYTTYTCRCGKTYVDDYVDATGHNYHSVVTPPTCVDKGYTTHTCKMCGDSYIDSYVDSPFDGTAHEYDSVVTEPTCTEQGYTTHTCSTCGHSYQDEYVDVLPHEYTSIATPPTCTKQGYTTHTCSDCGYSFINEYVNALGHRYNAVVTEPTCTEQGYTEYICECGDSYIDDYVGAIGHSCDEWELVSEPTCDVKGTEKGACTTCGVELTQKINALGHDYGELELEYDATCTRPGRYSKKCSRCENKTGVVIIPITGHHYGEWIIETEPTCETDGTKYHTCSTCGMTEKMSISKLGHDYTVEEIHSEATCTTPGCKTQYCSCCNHVNEVITPAMGHSFTSQIIQPATHTTEGVELLTCFCGEQEYKIIEKLPLGDNQLTILITGKDNVNKEDTTKDNANNEDVSKDDVGKEDISNEDTNKENVSKEDVSGDVANKNDANKTDGFNVSSESTKIVVCILLILSLTIGAYMIVHTIYIRKKRIK